MRGPETLKRSAPDKKAKDAAAKKEARYGTVEARAARTAERGEAAEAQIEGGTTQGVDTSTSERMQTLGEDIRIDRNAIVGGAITKLESAVAAGNVNLEGILEEIKAENKIGAVPKGMKADIEAALKLIKKRGTAEKGLQDPTTKEMSETMIKTYNEKLDNLREAA